MILSPFFRQFVFLLTVAGVLLGCSRGPTEAEKLSDSLSGVFERSADAPRIVRMAEVTDFKWDRVFVFPAKSSLKHLFETLERPIPYEVHATRIFDRDDINVLVFFRGDTVAEVVELDRTRVDISVPEGTGALSPGDAVFAPSLPARVLVLAGAQEAAR